jgi:hypothetical protein
MNFAVALAMVLVTALAVFVLIGIKKGWIKK